MRQPQSRIARDSEPSIQDLHDAIGWNMELSRKFSRADAQLSQLLS
jgi:hypothetical protein